jgi:flagellar biosynthetic protein FlhB
MMSPDTGGERTEQATPKRKQDARRKGQVARTAELGPALTLLAAYALFSQVGSQLLDNGTRMIHESATAMVSTQALTFERLLDLFLPQLLLAGQVVGAPLLALTAVAVVGQVAQTGVLIPEKALAPKWNRLNPLQGLKQLFSKQTLVTLVRSLLKTGAIAYLGWGVVREALQVAPELLEAPAAIAAAMAARLVGRFTRTVAILFLGVAGFDYLYQRWEHLQSLRMSRKEIADELKQSEGDPLIRQRIRQRQRRLAMSRMMAAIPTADAVVTNPVHLAVALKYDSRKMAAPVVVAKGAGLLAQRIKELAKEHRVPVIENIPLARGLFYGTEIGQSIPTEFYQAVAELLAYVYQIRPQRRRA